MAYNPFNIFRRNQKALFAVLTVFVMIVFTLSSGIRGGDFFESASRWLGASGGTAVCKIDGRAVTTRDLDGPRGLHFRRVMANRFMFYAANETIRALMEHASQQRERLSPAGKAMMEAAHQAVIARMQMEDPQLRTSPFGQFQLQQLFQRVQQGEQLVALTLSSADAKSDDKEVAQEFQTIFRLGDQLREAQGESYFVNAPNRNKTDLIEFMLWEKKADQLGIHFTQDDVKRLMHKEFYGYFTNDVNVRKLLQQTPGFTLESCMEAIGVEFKVRAAQIAVLGRGARYHRAPAYPIPYETFEYYREQCSPTTYEVIAVPAFGFVDRVTAEPTDAQISELFKKYADAEPNPKSETPGFKEPRKIAIAFLGITGQEPYYKKLAEEQIKVGEVMAKASGMLTVPLPGATGAWVTDATAALRLKDPAIDAAYNKYTSSFDFERDLKYRNSNVTTRDLLESSVVKPGVLAATLGGFVGQTAGGNLISAVSISIGAPIAYEIRDRVKAGVPIVLSGMPGPALFQQMVTGLATARANEPKPLPMSYMQPELLKNAIEARAKALAFGEQSDTSNPRVSPLQEQGDLSRFSEELKKMTEDGRPKDKAAVEKYIKEFIAKRGLTHFGGSTAPHDEWTMEEDPGLKPLVDAHKESLLRAKLLQAHGGAEPYSPFGRAFFWTTDFTRNGVRQIQATNLYQPEPYPPEDAMSRGEGRARYVYWRTEDIAPKKTNLITARPAVIAAWKRLQARELAQAYANRMAEQIRGINSSDPQVFDPVLNQLHFELQLSIKNPKAAERAMKFDIDNVTPLVADPRASMMAGLGGSQLQPFELRESNNIPYPTPEMRTALLDNREKAPKTVLVLADAPKDTFYVATLQRRELKTPSEFKMNVYSRLGNAQAILGRYYEDSATHFRQSVVDLLKKEFRYEVTEDQKKKLEENTKSGGFGD